MKFLNGINTVLCVISIVIYLIIFFYVIQLAVAMGDWTLVWGIIAFMVGFAIFIIWLISLNNKRRNKEKGPHAHA